MNPTTTPPFILFCIRLSYAAIAWHVQYRTVCAIRAAAQLYTAGRAEQVMQDKSCVAAAAVTELR